MLQFCFYLLHWAACGFWYVALQQGGGENKRTWVAQEEQMLSGSSTVELYIFSFYWALVTFATLGYVSRSIWQWQCHHMCLVSCMLWWQDCRYQMPSDCLTIAFL